VHGADIELTSRDGAEHSEIADTPNRRPPMGAWSEQRQHRTDSPSGERIRAGAARSTSIRSRPNSAGPLAVVTHSIMTAAVRAGGGRTGRSLLSNLDPMDDQTKRELENIWRQRVSDSWFRYRERSDDFHAVWLT
jgi:hypothetical protein